MADQRYQRLSITSKLAYALTRLRDDPVECPGCQTGVSPRELEAHQARCPGRGWGSLTLELAWVPWAELRAFVAWGLMHYWLTTKPPKVRRRKNAQGRWTYSRADVVAALEALEARRRKRTSTKARLAIRSRWRRV